MTRILSWSLHLSTGRAFAARAAGLVLLFVLILVGSPAQAAPGASPDPGRAPGGRLELPGSAGTSRVLAQPGQRLTASVPYTLTVHSWARTWTGSVDVIASGVAVDGAGNLYVVGEFAGTVNFDPAGPNAAATFTSQKNTYDAYLSKFDAAGVFQWARTWGGAPATTPIGAWDGRDAANGVAVDAAGNAYVVGLFQNTVDFGPGMTVTSNAPSGSNNILLGKFSADGVPQWVRAWGGKSGGEGYSVAVDKVRGYVYAVGDWSTAPDRGDVDFNPTGGHDWHTNHGFFDSYLVKYDLDGGFKWAKTWGGSQYDDGPGVAVDGAGSIYVGGMYGSTDINFDPAGGAGGLGHPASESSSIYVDVFLSKFNANGDFQWVDTWGGAGTEDAGSGVLVDGAGSVYLAGRFGCTKAQPCNVNGGPTGQPDPRGSNGDRDAFLSKYDAAGNYLWSRTWGGSGWDAVGWLAVDGADNVYAAGFFLGSVDFDEGGAGDVHTSRGGRDVSLTRFDPAGHYGWTKTWGGPGDDMGLRMAGGGTGDLFVVGAFSNTVDFNPWGEQDTHSALAGRGGYLSKFGHVIVGLEPAGYLPLVVR